MLADANRYVNQRHALANVMQSRPAAAAAAAAAAVSQHLAQAGRPVSICFC